MARAHPWTLPNAITAIRLGAGPVCLWLLIVGDRTALTVALAVMIAAETSDFFDGVVARAYRQMSSLGKILDPMADAFYRGCVFIGFAAIGWMPVWMLGPILLRDLVVSYLREIAELNAGTLGARASGKWKAIAQGAVQITIVGLALATQAEFFRYADWVHVLLLIAVAVTMYSLIDYAVAVGKKALQ